MSSASQQGISGSPGNTNLSPATFGVCDQSKEIPFDTSSENGIFWDGSKFSNHELYFDTGKGEQAATTMSGGTREPENITLETFRPHRLSVLHSTCSVTFPVTTEVFRAPAYELSREGAIIPIHNEIRSGLVEGDKIVVKQPSFDEWKVNSSTPLKTVIQTEASKKGWGPIAWEGQ